MTKEICRNWKELEAEIHAPSWPVSIDYARLDEVMGEHTSKALASTSHLPPIPGAGSKNPFVAASYILTGNIWNFHFKTPGQPPYRVANPENPEKPFEGFIGFWHKLYQRCGERVITADMLRPHVASVEAMRDFFHDLADIPLPELRQRCGADYVRQLDRYYEGSSLFILRDVASGGAFRAYNGGGGLVEVLTRRFVTAYGQDYRTFDGRTYAFFKRARLVAMSFHQYAISSGGRMITPLEDADDLGPVVDYQIPRILRALGVLVYSPALETAIEQGMEIPRGSTEEVMIRAASAVAFAHWMEEKNIPGWQLDSYLFSISRGLPNKAHYTKTSDY